METLWADYLANLTADLTMGLLGAAKSRTREALTGGPAQEALERCTRAGLAALLAKAMPAGADDAALLADLFKAFFAEPDTAREVAALLRGDPLDVAELRYVFEAAGYDAETLPGLPFEPAVRLFEAAFVQQVVDEPELRETLAAAQSLAQTYIQRALLEEMRGFNAFLREHWNDLVGIRANTIIAQNVVSGVQYTYALPGNGGIAPSPEEEQHYLRTLIARCDPLDFTPIDETRVQPGGIGQAASVKISDVFTTLYLDGVTRFPDQSVAEAVLRRETMEHSKRPSEEKPQPVTAVEAAGGLERLVILGHPGGGKSTLLNYLVTQLARRRQGAAAELTGWPDDARPLPVLVTLRRFAARLPAKSLGTAGDVWGYLEAELKAAGCEEFFPTLKHILKTEGGVVCFDGLDEVSVAEAETRRAALVRAIAEFARPLEHCRVLVTCRNYAYEHKQREDGRASQQEQSWRLPEHEFTVVRLALFDLPQIEMFAKTWYGLVGPGKGWSVQRCKQEAAHLFHSVQKLPHLRELAQYPLLLTLMAQVHGRDGTLPDDRADLYERAVNLLLAHWENRLVRDVRGGECVVEPGLVARLDVSLSTLRTALESVALDAHLRQETQRDRNEQAADIPKEDLREALRVDLGSLDRAEVVIDYVQERAGLLQAQDNRTYRFPHRTFQEYLAAQAVLRQDDFDTWLRDCVQRDLTWWREVFLLAAGSRRAVPRNVADLVEELFLREPEWEAVRPERVPWAVLAAQALVEAHFVVEAQRITSPRRFKEVYTGLQSWLLNALRADETLAATERAAAGAALARLGDSRSEVTTLAGMEFCYVPAGPFWMGEGSGQHLNKQLQKGYWLARYPVTVAQWQMYVTESRVQPGDADSLRGLANHPVRYVSWHEALKFCDWLKEQAWREGWLPESWRLTLPSEAEWEKAARGGVQIPAANMNPRALQAGLGPVELVNLKDNSEPKREYPWGDKADPNRANYDDTNIGETSAVGCFPGGKSVYGVEDLSGNVWEWTRSLWGKNWQSPDFKYPYRIEDEREDLGAGDDTLRVLRGGAFDDGVGLVRCAYRGWSYPDSRNYYLGFRVVASPIPSVL